MCDTLIFGVVFGVIFSLPRKKHCALALAVPGPGRVAFAAGKHCSAG